MTAQPDQTADPPLALGGHITISVDAMGGDTGPGAVVAGIALSAREFPDIGFSLHGPKEQLEPLVKKKRVLRGRVDIRDARDVVTMQDKPSHVMRNGKGTSMWSAVDSVRGGDAAAVVSCGNTGALMAISMIRLRKLPGVNRPAIAILFPSRNPQGFNLMLDVGADIRADAPDLLQYALMGASYARNGLELTRPRIGLLNVGTEEHKGRPELKEAHGLISDYDGKGNFDFVGFVEGSDITGDRVDVIVTDGFTGNVAIKTGEGTASLIGDLLRQAFRHSVMSRIASVLALSTMYRLKKRIDPRRVNGGVFLGLNGIVVKSHGGADELGVSAAVRLAYQLARSGFAARLAARVAPNAGAADFEADNREKGQA